MPRACCRYTYRAADRLTNHRELLLGYGLFVWIKVSAILSHFAGIRLSTDTLLQGEIDLLSDKMPLSMVGSLTLAKWMVRVQYAHFDFFIAGLHPQPIQDTFPRRVAA